MSGAIDRLERHATVQPAAYHALDEHYKTALNMITGVGIQAGLSRLKPKQPRFVTAMAAHASDRAAFWPAV